MIDDNADRLEAVADEPERRRLIGIALLPSAATLGNLLCGVIAIFCCLLAMRTPLQATAPARHALLAEFFPSYIAGGAYLIVLAMIFDALDGRLARIARRTSEFGAQLDSLADIVSFGVAPALLLLTLLLRLAGPEQPAGAVPLLQWRLALVASLIYASCAAIRLARYNAENTRDETAHVLFTGLPAPGAAAAFVSLLILHEDLAHGGLLGPGVDGAGVLRWAIGPIVFCLAMLMVSRLDYVHVFNLYVRRVHPPIHLVWLLLAAAIAWYSPQVLLVLLAYAYLVSGLVLNALRWPRGAAAPGAARAAPRALRPMDN